MAKNEENLFLKIFEELKRVEESNLLTEFAEFTLQNFDLNFKVNETKNDV